VNGITWLLLTIGCIMLQGFYSMSEMACVAFDRVRLHYYASKKKKRALWLSFLLHNPSRLFGTTLLMVNISLQIGSECSRQFYTAFNLPASLAPLTQVFAVLIFAELGPMLAAYRYPEAIAMKTVPVIYATSKLMQPAIFAIDWLLKGMYKLLGKRTESVQFFTRDELQHLFEGLEKPTIKGEGQGLESTASNIFKLREKTARDSMHPLNKWPVIHAQSTVFHARKLFAKTRVPFLPILHKKGVHIVGIVHPVHLLKAPDNQRAREFAAPPRFISERMEFFKMLKQLNSEEDTTITIVLNENGTPVGFLTTKDILNQIVTITHTAFYQKQEQDLPKRIIERTLPAQMKLSDFNRQFKASIVHEPGEDFAQLLKRMLQHQPEKNDAVHIGPFEIRVEEASLLEVKTISVKTE